MPTVKETFEAMPGRFRPDKAGGTNAVVQYDVRRPDAGVNAVMLSQLDLLHCLGDRGHQTRGDGGRATGDRDHDTVVVRISVRVEEMGFAGRRRERSHHIRAAALGKVGHRLEKNG